jgi:uncharacterized protein (DUF58 family)
MISRVRLRQPAVPMLIAFLLALQLMDPSRVWTILFVAMTGMFITANLWAWSLGRSLQLRRETRLGWVQVGGQIEERYTLSNTSLFPASWIQFNDQSTLPDFNPSRSLSIGAGYFEQWTVGAFCNRRGLYYLGDATIITGDPFGIFEVNIHASQRTSVLVLPQIATLPEMLIAPSGTFGEGRPRRNAPEQTIHASTVREYADGDSRRLIHWPTTARTNKVFVRLMESAPEGNWWILLDLDKKYMLGEGWDSIEEQSVTLAASLANYGLHKRKSVGLITNGRELTWLRPDKGDGQRWQIMQELAVARPGSPDLDTILERTQSSIGRHHSLIVITASTKLGWLKTVLPLTMRGTIPTVLLMDAFAYGGETSAEKSAAILMQRDIACHVIPRGMIPLPKARPQDFNNFTWRPTPGGEIRPVRN